MTAGFMMDETHSVRHPLAWVEGEAVRSFFFGTKIKGRSVYVTETYRCEGCGALRSYATARRT